jgi:hypothetical protein
MADARQRAIVLVDQGQGEQDTKRGQDETEAGEHTTPPPGTGVA